MRSLKINDQSSQPANKLNATQILNKFILKHFRPKKVQRLKKKGLVCNDESLCVLTKSIIYPCGFCLLRYSTLLHLQSCCFNKQSFEFTQCICLHTCNLCTSFIFNKFKFLNKSDECALKALLVIIRKA